MSRRGRDQARPAGQLKLGNLAAIRDWGYAKEYVEGMWRMLQHREPRLRLATGTVQRSRSPCEAAFEPCRAWTGREYVRYDERYERPTEVDALIGDASKARERARLEAPDRSPPALAHLMVDADLTLVGGSSQPQHPVQGCHHLLQRRPASGPRQLPSPDPRRRGRELARAEGAPSLQQVVATLDRVLGQDGADWTRRPGRDRRRPSVGPVPGKPTFGFQPSISFGLARVAEQRVHLGGPQVARVDLDVLVPVQPGMVEGDLDDSRTECFSPVATT